MKHPGTSLVLAVAAALVTASSARAQSRSAEIGVTAGLNLASLAGAETPTEKRTSRSDFMAGVFLIYPSRGPASLQAEIDYSRQGGKLSDQGAEAVFKINYITIPVMLRLGFSDKIDGVRPALYGGPFIAVKAGCSASFQQGTLNLNGDCGSSSVDVQVNRMDFGVTLGGEVAYGPMGVFARYSVGLQSIDNQKTNPQDITNRVATFGGRWTLGSIM